MIILNNFYEVTINFSIFVCYWDCDVFLYGDRSFLCISWKMNSNSNFSNQFCSDHDPFKWHFYCKNPLFHVLGETTRQDDNDSQYFTILDGNWKRDNWCWKPVCYMAYAFLGRWVSYNRRYRIWVSSNALWYWKGNKTKENLIGIFNMS